MASLFELCFYDYSFKSGFSVFTSFQHTYTLCFPDIYISFQGNHITIPYALVFPTNMTDLSVSSSMDLMNSGFTIPLPIAIHINGVHLYAPLLLIPFLHSGSCPLFSSHNSGFMLHWIFGANPKYFLLLFKTDRGSPFWLSVGVGLCGQMISSSVFQDYRAFACVTEI